MFSSRVNTRDTYLNSWSLLLDGLFDCINGVLGLALDHPNLTVVPWIYIAISLFYNTYKTRKSSLSCGKVWKRIQRSSVLVAFEVITFMDHWLAKNPGLFSSVHIYEAFMKSVFALLPLSMSSQPESVRTELAKGFQKLITYPCSWTKQEKKVWELWLHYSKVGRREWSPYVTEGLPINWSFNDDSLENR